MDTILDTPIHEYEKFLAAHGVSAIRIAQLLLPGMLERGSGTFVTISSGAGTSFYPRNPPGQAGVGLGYRIGKAAGHTIVGSILAEYASSGIRASTSSPASCAPNATRWTPASSASTSVARHPRRWRSGGGGGWCRRRKRTI
jgi:NAD(P)-dependent dehydrogenase (short-subunit alcohol dehydrogenase family)